MQTLPPQIISFIGKHHVLTLATIHRGAPHCASVFYAFLEREARFAFLSDNNTEHIRHIGCCAETAGNIVLETRNVGRIQGLQMRGRAYLPEGEQATEAMKAYVLRFPYTFFSVAPLWIFEPQWVKFTDNRLGFGKKLLWNRSECTT